MASKGRLFVLGALSLIGLFCFRADEVEHAVLPTTETPRLRSSFKDVDFPRRFHDFERSLSEDVKDVVKDPVEHFVKDPVERFVKDPVEHFVKDPVEHVVKAPVENVVKDPVENVVKALVEAPTDDYPYFEEVHFTLRILMNSTFNPFAQIAKHTDCLAQCERRVFDAYIR
jgi:hypothetical protein